MNASSEKWVLIANPAAGGGRGRERAVAMMAHLRSLDISFAEQWTTHPGHAAILARNARNEGNTHFLIMGGDGTSYEVINGLFGDGEKPKVRLGLLPTGTGNSFLRDFSEDGANHTFSCLENGQSRPCDVIRLTHESGNVVFMNLLSFGFVADVALTANRRFKRFGQAGYVASVLTNLIGLKSKPWHLSLDGQEIDENFTFVSINNSRFTGGKMMMAPEADVSDGLADVILVNSLSRAKLLRIFPEIFSGKHVNRPFVQTKRAKKIDFHCEDEVDFMIDGEVDRFRPKSLEVLPGVMEVFA